jgi:hypothetical protein
MDKESLFWHRVKLIALIAVFLSPFIGGWLALYVFEYKPDSVNYGTLVQPVKKLQWPALESSSGEQLVKGFGEKWVFLIFAGDACTQQCQSNLFYMRQIRTLLGRDTPRLLNVLVVSGAVDAGLNAYLTDYPSLVVIRNDSEILYSQFQLSDIEPVGSSPRLYLVDPDNNYMMFYPAEIDHYRVLDDLKKLMKLSQIG